MKKTIVSLTFTVLSTVTLFSQQKMGGYLNFNEFKYNTPKYETEFKVEKRTKTSIVMMGGNDYKVTNQNPEITASVIKNELWGVYSCDTLYLNSKKITKVIWYSKVEELGRYDFLKVPFPASKKIQNELGVSFTNLGTSFGAVGGAVSGAQLATMRLLFVFDSETGDTIFLNEENLTKLLEQNKELKNNYLSEVDRNNEETIKKYLFELNKNL